MEKRQNIGTKSAFTPCPIRSKAYKKRGGKRLGHDNPKITKSCNINGELNI